MSYYYSVELYTEAKNGEFPEGFGSRIVVGAFGIHKVCFSDAGDSCDISRVP